MLRPKPKNDGADEIPAMLALVAAVAMLTMGFLLVTFTSGEPLAGNGAAAAKVGSSGADARG